MTKHWTTPRNELLPIAADLVVNRGYTAEGVAETMASGHFYGLDRRRAQRRFLADLQPLVADGFKAKYDQYFADLRAKEDQLVAEGWRWVGCMGEGIFVHDGFGYEVNPCGGVYANKERAILATWDSVSRQKVVERLECQKEQEEPHV